MPMIAMPANPIATENSIQKPRPAGGLRPGAVEDADVVQPQESAGEQVAAGRVLPVDPPGEVEGQLVECSGQEEAVLLPGLLVHPSACPGVDRRVHVGEIELVGR